MRRFLYINGQDINKIIFAIANDDRDFEIEEVDSDPSDFLLAIQTFLKENKITVTDFEKIFVVAGPGSATALRAVLSIVNAIKFVHDVRIYPIEKSPAEQDSYTFKNCLDGKIDEIEHKKYFYPIYGSGPKITLSTKDELGR